MRQNTTKMVDDIAGRMIMDKDKLKNRIITVILWAVIVGVIIWNIALGNSLDDIISWRTVSIVLAAYLIKGRKNKRS